MGIDLVTTNIDHFGFSGNKSETIFPRFFYQIPGVVPISIDILTVESTQQIFVDQQFPFC